LIKQAYIDVRKEKEELEQQLQFQKQRNAELEKDNAETSQKYMRLYEENEKLQETL